MRVLGSYPDYSKATPGYVAGISEAFSQYDRDIQEHLADIAVGLCARHSYLPTVENVITLGREFLAEKARKQDFDKRFSGRKVYDIDQPRITARPFPRLWAAIGPTADADFRGMEFDLIADIAKTQHLKGEDAARRQLQSLKAEHKRRAA